MSTTSYRGRLRRIATLLLGLILVGALPAVGAAAPREPAELRVEVLRLSPAGVARAVAGISAARSPRPCNDKAYTLEGGRWRQTYKWSFRIGTTPSGLNRAAVEGAVKKGINNIVKANNDCGRADRVKATASYQGTTTRKPSCAIRDGYNVIGFRKLPLGVAARACWWYSAGRIVEADVQINNRLRWATSLAGCSGQLMLEAVMTHEAGHVFGLGHVGEGRHGRLTMSTYIDGTCQNNESTLGLGDMLGLEKLYP
jgi:hypothetical protein